MTPEAIKEHIMIYGRLCYNCDELQSVDYADEESELTELWCDVKHLKMNCKGALNCKCDVWIERDDSN